MNVQAQTKIDEAAPVQLPTIPRKAEIRVVTDPIPVLDTARFEHMQRIANVMANSNLIPDSLCMTTEGEGQNKQRVALPPGQVMANCFLVVNQAVRWGMDPFAVAQCVSVVHGKLCYEGKLIAAVIEAKLGIRLKFKWDDKQGDQLGITVSGQFDDENEPRIVQGTIAEWKTTGNGSPWTAKQSPKMLAYRGAREWGRLHAPSLMLGVYSDDELENLADESRSTRARDITPRDDGPPPPPPRVTQQAQPVTAEVAPRLSDIELVESGRDDGKKIEWAENGETPSPSTAPTETAMDQQGEKEWLNDLSGAFSGCENLEQFSTKQRDCMAPKKGHVSPEAWTAAQRLAEDTYHRVKDN